MPPKGDLSNEKMRNAEKYRKWESYVRKVHARGPRKYGKILALSLALAISLSLIWTLGPEEGARPKKLTKFTSEEEFRNYLSNVGWMGIGLYYIGAYRPKVLEDFPVGPTLGPAPAPTRVSGTTVQVAGIDEPDIVKTDGIHIYFSPNSEIWTYTIGIDENVEVKPFLPSQPAVRVIKAFPPSELSLKARIEKSGEMLLIDNILVIFSTGEICGYDISNPESPEEVWTIQLTEALVSARLYEGYIYFVTQSYVDSTTPMPLIPMRVKRENFVIKVTDIHHPVDLVPVDAVYTAVILDPKQGEIKKSVSFVGFSGTSVVYMSKGALYITYTYYPSPVRAYYDFIKERCGDLISAEDMARIDKIMGYDISDRAKLLELQIILNPKMSEIQERAKDYFAEKKREFELTGIVKIGLERFEIEAHGEVPGAPLNQFSLDEHEGYLRIATTVEPTLWMFGLGSAESANDVYVLDENLKLVGSVRDLGKTERIYSVRFIGDKGYVVTFRETDPFYVLDLSDPKEPKLSGELKIPGYSSYLHPISDDLILGIGKEGDKVKISLFDVSSPSQPLEIDKHLLDEFWSDVLETHHAFLLDREHEVFFLPAGQWGYVFSYAGNEIKAVMKADVAGTRRAVYIEDFLYVLAAKGVIVFDEKTWEKINEIEIT
ncbi:MAG: beta-propeller domain-containing protein [Hadesarchaea archaeon]|nr:beta-propeller domain-containing protein [Hadesarchaea archaeon]